MWKQLLRVGTSDDKNSDWNFKIRMINTIAVIVLAIIPGYVFVHITSGDDLRVLYFHLPYVFTSTSILILNASHRNISAINVASISYPICFLITCIAFGKLFHVEYQFLMTIGTTFFFYTKKKHRQLSVVYNISLFIIAKFYFLYHPDAIFYVKTDDAFIVSLMQGVTVILFVVYVVQTTFENKEQLNQQLLELSENQEAIIAMRTLELERSSEELRRFSYISAHDLREPLRNIIGFAQLLHRSIQRKEYSKTGEYVDFMNKSIARMDRVTNDVVNYVKIEGLLPNVEVINTQDIAFEVEKELKKQYSKKNITIRIAHLPTLTMNPNLFKTVIFNLVKNAILYCKKMEIRISVSCEEREIFYHFSVEDNGEGVEKEYQETIFIMFKRLQNDLENQGSGIGLAICKKIIEAHHGKIWVESQKGVGSIFYFTIPKMIQ